MVTKHSFSQKLEWVRKFVILLHKTSFAMNIFPYALYFVSSASLCLGTVVEKEDLSPVSEFENANSSQMTCEAAYLSENTESWNKGDVIFTFKNTGIKTIYLLDLFESDFMIRVFFLIRISNAKGERVSLDDRFIACIHTASDTKCRAIFPGSSFILTIPLEDHIKKTHPAGLPKGTYTLNISYTNKWNGKEKCIQGVYPPPPVEFQVK